MVFFVLSGHVLWGSFARKVSLTDFPDYLCAHVFGIIPLVIVSTLAFSIVVHPARANSSPGS